MVAFIIFSVACQELEFTEAPAQEFLQQEDRDLQSCKLEWDFCTRGGTPCCTG